jgi:hypothetical protein
MNAVKAEPGRGDMKRTKSTEHYMTMLRVDQIEGVRDLCHDLYETKTRIQPRQAEIVRAALDEFLQKPRKQQEDLLAALRRRESGAPARGSDQTSLYLKG